MGVILYKHNLARLLVSCFLILVSSSWGQTIIFSEDFSSVITGNNTTVSGSKTKWKGNERTSVINNVYKAGKAVKLGIATSSGAIKIKPLDLSKHGGMFTLKLDVKGWSSVEGDIKITVDELPEQLISYKAKMNDTFETKEIYLAGGTSHSVITIETTEKRIFIDNIIISQAESPFLFVSDLIPFGEICVESESINSFSIKGSLLTSSVKINKREGFTFSEIKEGNYYTSLQIEPFEGIIKEKKIYVKFTPDMVKSYDDTIIIQYQQILEIRIPISGSGISTDPVVINKRVDSITNNSAVLVGVIADEGCSIITEIGFEYNKDNNFDETTNVVAKAEFTEQNTFQVTIENLTDNTVYFYRSYAINSNGVVYGNSDSLSTLRINIPVSLEASEKEGVCFTANWTKVKDAVSYKLDVSEFPDFGIPIPSTDLILSEYIEGSSYNKAIEIYNNTNRVIDLSCYSVKKQTNGKGDFKGKLKLEGSIEKNSAYVIVYGKANTSLKNYADMETNSSVMTFTGNDAIALYKDSLQIDVVGIVDQKTDWGKDLTLVRKPQMINPTIDFSFKDWMLFETDTFDNLGKHISGQYDPSFVTIYEDLNVGDVNSYKVIGLMKEKEYYYRVRAVGVNSISSSSNMIYVAAKVKTPVWNGENWSNITGPDITLDAIIEGDYTTLLAPLTARNLIVKSGEFTIASNTSVIVEKAINVKGGTFFIENKGSLLQIEDIDNEGEIVVQTESEPMLRFDYSCWSSPVKNQKLFDFSSETYLNTFHIFNPVLGTREITNSDNNFESTKGYLIQTPALWSRKIRSPYFGDFIGVPNNGLKTIYLQQAEDQQTGYNLIGNPYPSPISIDKFIEQNQGLIDGTVYFWIPNHSMNNDRSYKAGNYAVYTKAGSTSTQFGGVFPEAVVQSGQGFFVNTLTDNAKIVFTNEMRLANHQNPFFSTIDETLTNSYKTEKHSIHLNLTNDEGVFSQLVITYRTDATNGVDKGIDGKIFKSPESCLYTLIDNNEYAVQGRPLPFNESDTVTIGYKVLKSRDYTITLDKAEGMFNENQFIYLKDNATNTIHNLVDKAYNFSSEKGIFNKRFEILYNIITEMEKIPLENKKVIVYNQNGVLSIDTQEDTIREVAIFNLGGEEVYRLKKLDTNTVTIHHFTPVNQVLIIKIYTMRQGIVFKKIIY